MELFVLLVTHCSDGDGTTASVKGAYDNLRTPVGLARNIEDEQLTMSDFNHGVYIWILPLNSTFKTRNPHRIYARCYNPNSGTLDQEVWFFGYEQQHKREVEACL